MQKFTFTIFCFPLFMKQRPQIDAQFRGQFQREIVIGFPKIGSSYRWKYFVNILKKQPKKKKKHETNIRTLIGSWADRKIMQQKKTVDPECE